MAIQFSDENFEAEVLKSDQVVLVDFWAPWCGPCQMMGPIIEQLSEEAKGEYKVGKVNVDENPQISQKYGIMSIPTLAIFKDGQLVKQLLGVQSKESLMDELKEFK
jgi:thioredoxin 1